MKPGRPLRDGIGPQDGLALPLTLVVLLLLTVMGFALFSLGLTEVAIGTNWMAYSATFYGAEAGTEAGVVGLRDRLGQTPNPTDAQLAAIGPPTLSDPNLSFTAFSVTRALPSAPYSYQTTFTTGPYAGLSGTVTDYRVSAQVSGAGGTRANVSQIVRYVQVPLFQFGVFYGKGVDLEIAPGPDMTFNGRVHSNSNIYLGPGSTLSFDSYMTTAGGIYRRLKRDAAVPYGTNPRIKDANGVYQTLDFDHDYQPGFGSRWGSEQDWKARAESVYGPGGRSSTVKDRAMGVGEIIPPIPDLFYNPSNPDVISRQMIEMPRAGDSPELRAAKLYSQADLRIIDGVATDRNGNPVSLPGGAIQTRTFYDGRERRTMTVTDVNIAALGSAAPANGILYVASTGGAGNGVRLVNAKRLPSQGLTVVSENPVYVAGDYNVLDTVPAAILADAITVLSNKWLPRSRGGESDDEAGGGYDDDGDKATNLRNASNTTVNAAFALGPSAESELGTGNGQLENVIRFLEDWKNKTFTYRGSIVALWHSMQATAPWRCCGSSGDNYYSPPVRNWSYDTRFGSNAPPGTPSGVIMARGPWSQQ